MTQRAEELKAKIEPIAKRCYEYVSDDMPPEIALPSAIEVGEALLSAQELIGLLETERDVLAMANTGLRENLGRAELAITKLKSDLARKEAENERLKAELEEWTRIAQVEGDH